MALCYGYLFRKSFDSDYEYGNVFPKGIDDCAVDFEDCVNIYVSLNRVNILSVTLWYRRRLG